MVWGILLLLVVGYSWLAEVGTGYAALWAGRITSIIYGVGAALMLHEFALWLNLRDVYWERQGRESLEAMVLFLAVLVQTRRRRARMERCNGSCQWKISSEDDISTGDYHWAAS